MIHVTESRQRILLNNKKGSQNNYWPKILLVMTCVTAIEMILTQFYCLIYSQNSNIFIFQGNGTQFISGPTSMDPKKHSIRATLNLQQHRIKQLQQVSLNKKIKIYFSKSNLGLFNNQKMEVVTAMGSNIAHNPTK